MTRMTDQGLKARSGALIAGAFLTASVLGFVLLGVVARWLTQEQNAQFLALWGLVFGVGSALSAVEQEIVRVATNAHLDGVKVPGRALQVTGLAIGAATVVVACIVLLPGVGELLRDSVLVAGLVFVATGGFAVQCLTRAVLLGTGQVRAYVLVVVLEAALRLALVVGFVLFGVRPGLGLGVLVIVIGCFGWVPVIRRVTGSLTRDTSGSSLRSAGSAVGALGLANGLQSLQVTAFPALASALLGTSAAMAPLFGAVTLARLPLVALAPVQAMAVPVATRLIRTGRLDRLMNLVVRLSTGGFVCALLAVVGGVVLGPWALELYMGEGYVVAGPVIGALLGASCVLAVALLEVAALIALERYWTAVVVWLVAAVVLLITLAVLPLPPSERVAAGVVAAATTSWLAATSAVAHEARRRPRTDDGQTT